MSFSSKSGDSWEIPNETYTFDDISTKVPAIILFMSRLQCSSRTSKLKKSIIDGSVIVVSDDLYFPVSSIGSYA